MNNVKNMDVSWPFKKRELGDSLLYDCPNNLMVWHTNQTTQTVTFNAQIYFVYWMLLKKNAMNVLKICIGY